MCQHPALIESIARQRTAELRRLAASGRGAHGGSRGAQTSSRGAHDGSRRGVRGATGWLLVELGLRLAVRRDSIDRMRTPTSN